MNQNETISRLCYPSFITAKIIGTTERTIVKPWSDDVLDTVHYGKSFFRKYRKPFTVSINITNVVAIQRYTYDTVKMTKKELPKGLFRRLFGMKPLCEYELVKDGEITVDRLCLVTGDILFAEQLKKYNIDDQLKD